MGKYAEYYACQYLQTQRYQLIYQNWEGKRGEIDLVVSYENTLIWLEVRSIEKSWLSHGLQSITQQKCQQVSRCAQEFLSKETHIIQNFDHFQFDVIGIRFQQQNKCNYQLGIIHVPNAFYAHWAF